MAERTIRRCSDLAELALDRRTADNTQSRIKWCEGLGLDHMDVGHTADQYFDARYAAYEAVGADFTTAEQLAHRDLFLYGLLLGRELGS